MTNPLKGQHKTFFRPIYLTLLIYDMLLRDNSVDVIISDLPFGKRSGSKADNRVLYPRTLNAMARLVKPATGRAVLLTQVGRCLSFCLWDI